MLLRVEAGEAEEVFAVSGGVWDAVDGAVQLLDAVCLLGVMGFRGRGYEGG